MTPEMGQELADRFYERGYIRKPRGVIGQGC